MFERAAGSSGAVALAAKALGVATGPMAASTLIHHTPTSATATMEVLMVKYGS